MLGEKSAKVEDGVGVDFDDAAVDEATDGVGWVVEVAGGEECEEVLQGEWAALEVGEDGFFGCGRGVGCVAADVALAAVGDEFFAEVGDEESAAAGGGLGGVVADGIEALLCGLAQLVVVVVARADGGLVDARGEEKELRFVVAWVVVEDVHFVHAFEGGDDGGGVGGGTRSDFAFVDGHFFAEDAGVHAHEDFEQGAEARVVELETVELLVGDGDVEGGGGGVGVGDGDEAFAFEEAESAEAFAGGEVVGVAEVL